MFRRMHRLQLWSEGRVYLFEGVERGIASRRATRLQRFWVPVVRQSYRSSVEKPRFSNLLDKISHSTGARYSLVFAGPVELGGLVL